MRPAPKLPAAACVSVRWAGNRLTADVVGDAYGFLDFRVHYIGQAFSQKVWKRLTGHEKMQSILTREGPIGASAEARAPFEISLMLLDIVGLTEACEFPHTGHLDRPGYAPIRHRLDDDDAVVTFVTQQFVSHRDAALTRELEALLIRSLQPSYNETLFANYPNITGGMRSKGYTWTDIVLEQTPALLFTDHHPLTLLNKVLNAVSE